MRMASVFAQRWHSWLRELQLTRLTHDAALARRGSDRALSRHGFFRRFGSRNQGVATRSAAKKSSHSTPHDALRTLLALDATKSMYKLVLVITAAAARAECVVKKQTHAFYYLWYGTPATDGKWLHWDHACLLYTSPSPRDRG